MQSQNLIAKKKIEHYTYFLNDIIGKGYSSKVYKGKDEVTQEVVAIKVIDMKSITNEVEKQLVFQEINALKLIQSQNVVKLLDYYHTANNTYIVTEYCNQGHLAKFIQDCGGYITEQEAVKILRHILNGFRDQIKKGVLHRDIKPTNILFKNHMPKLADYGFSKMIKAPKEKVYYRVGTPIYMSPESFLENRYSEKSDIWSLGVVYYEMIYGQCPWVINDESEFQDSVSQLHFPRSVAVSEESKDFLRKALHIEDNLRISLVELDSHPLFMRRNTTTLTKPRSAAISNSYNKSITSLNLVRVNQTQNPVRSGSSNKPLTSPDRKEQAHKHQKSIQLCTKPHEKISTVIQHNYTSFHYESICEEVVINQLNYCKFLYRTSQLSEHVKQFQSPRIRDRMLGFLAKDMMETMNKLKDIYEKGLNALRIANFNHNQAILILNRAQFKEHYQRYREYQLRNPDCGDLVLRDSIRELNHNLRISDMNEPGILLLDYLVFYYQLLECKLGCQIVDGRPPSEITQAHYQEIRLKIYNLGI